ncbi:Uncharacterised protein [Pseudomonas aeruginosa]|nr:Uncharacterised protein [Pseudomonas aeruginosa]
MALLIPRSFSGVLGAPSASAGRNASIRSNTISKAATRIGRQRQVAAADQAHLVIELYVFRRQRLGQGQHPLAVALAIVDRFRQGLGDRDAVQHVEYFGKHAAPVRPLLGQVAHRFEQGARIASSKAWSTP